MSSSVNQAESCFLSRRSVLASWQNLITVPDYPILVWIAKISQADNVDKVVNFSMTERTNSSPEERLWQQPQGSVKSKSRPESRGGLQGRPWAVSGDSDGCHVSQCCWLRLCFYSGYDTVFSILSFLGLAFLWNQCKTRETCFSLNLCRCSLIY